MPTLTSASNYLENALLDLVFNGTTYTPPSNVYVALYTAAPSDAGGGTEVSGGSYARQAAAFGSASSRTSATTADLDWTGMPAGTASHVGIFDAATSGNLLFWGELDAPVVIGSGDPFTIPAGGLEVEFLASPVTDYLAHNLLDHVLRSESYSPPTTVELALYDDTDTELSGAGYSRQVQGYGTAASGSATSDTDAIFTNLPAAIVEAAGLHEDASSGGNALFYGPLGTARTVSAGATWECLAGQSVISLD